MKKLKNNEVIATLDNFTHFCKKNDFHLNNDLRNLT